MRKITSLFILLCVLGLSRGALAVKIADITRIEGQRTNVLTGLGLVFGLKGTGDGGDYMPAIRPLVSMLAKFGDPATVTELSKAQNVAVVQLTAVVPSVGARNGDHIDVYVVSSGAATSLKGGRLFICPMQGSIPNGGIYAMSQGPITIEDPSDPLHGVVKGGCVMEVDLKPQYIDNGKFKLIIEDPSASWTNSSTIAKMINDAMSENGETIAVASDPKEVVVSIPPSEREHPDSFIANVQRLPLPLLPTEARVQVNEKTGTLIVTGDVEISPVVISHKGLTITTVAPAANAPAAGPRARSTVALDTANSGGAKLQDLVNALEQLKVPVDDRITIVKELYKTGKLHAKLIME